MTTASDVAGKKPVDPPLDMAGLESLQKQALQNMIDMQAYSLTQQTATNKITAFTNAAKAAIDNLKAGSQ